MKKHGILTVSAVMLLMCCLFFEIQKIPLPITVSERPAAEVSAPVNINTAGPEALASLPGISSADVKHILDFRKEIGPFRTLKEILEIPGFTEEKLSSLKHLITLGGS